MEKACSYCNQLTKALHSNNFCSQAGDDMHKTNSNAFYFKTNQLHSGKHISRLTLRSIDNGYQHHIVRGKNFMLDADKYLITNEGDTYQSEIETNHPIEGLVIAFSHDLVQSVGYYLAASPAKLLDDPFIKADLMEFRQQTFHQSKNIRSILSDFKESIFRFETSALNYDEKFHRLMLLMMEDRKLLESKIDLIEVKKKSTRKEIFKRLSTAKEYIDAHLDDNINLEKLSRVCTMSPFHFLRSFKSFYGQTPHQYLTFKRLQKARFLIRDTTLPIEQIAILAGFEYVRSFRRAFKRFFDIAPNAYRTSCV